MIERRARLFLDGTFLPGVISAEGERIVRVEAEAVLGSRADDLPLLAPGLIDLHVHGFGGCEPLTDLAGMATALARAGTTGFQPTLFPDAPERLGAAAAGVHAAAQMLRSGARSLGAHLEGPFVNPQAAGALPPEALVDPSPAALRALLGTATGDGRGIRTMTVAPELNGAPALIEELTRAGIRVSLGHSRATYAEASAGARAGAGGATHLYNAMRPWHHREGGLVGFTLDSGELAAEVIGDLVHVGEHAIALALAARGPHGLCLVSDALPGAGTGCEVFHSRGRGHVIADGAAYYGEAATPAGERQLAGSATPQLQAIVRLVKKGVLSIEEALLMGTEAPAQTLGETDLGRLREGALADWIVLDPNSLELREVVARGEPVPLG